MLGWVACTVHIYFAVPANRGIEVPVPRLAMPTRSGRAALLSRDAQTQQALSSKALLGSESARPEAAQT